MSEPPILQPYAMAHQPVSDGRIFLARAFAGRCALLWGMRDDEVARVLAGEAPDEEGRVIGATRDLGRTFMEGGVETYARPFGGGSPMLLPRSSWELDDFTERFRCSAIDPRHPFDAQAEPTHWLFVCSADFDAVSLPESVTPCKPRARPMAREAEAGRVPATAAPSLVPATPFDRFIRKEDGLGLVPFSRSTLDDRVRRGLFPRSHDLGGGIMVWWESEVVDWMKVKGQRGSAPAPAVSDGGGAVPTTSRKEDRRRRGSASPSPPPTRDVARDNPVDCT